MAIDEKAVKDYWENLFGIEGETLGIKSPESVVISYINDGGSQVEAHNAAVKVLTRVGEHPIKIKNATENRGAYQVICWAYRIICGK